MNDLVKLDARMRELEDTLKSMLELINAMGSKMKEHNAQILQLKNVLAEKNPSGVKYETKYQVGDKVRLVIDNYATTITRIVPVFKEDGVIYNYYFKDDFDKEFYVWECDIIEKVE